MAILIAGSEPDKLIATVSPTLRSDSKNNSTTIAAILELTVVCLLLKLAREVVIKVVGGPIRPLKNGSSS